MAATLRGPVIAWTAAALAVAGVTLALRDSFAGMAHLWQSSTFSYGALIAPISLFLIWRERARLAAMHPRPGWIAVALLVPVTGAWALGQLLDVNVVHHLAAAIALALAIWAVLGTAVARVIWFPLAYLLLMVPFSEFLVPTLMQWTADFAVRAVSLSGVPVYQDGYVFSLPGTDFEVIKACSGIRFLMATVAAGTLFAWLSYQSWRKRLLFLLATVLVPIVANLLRAYLVVMIVHLSNGRLAGAHVTYGMIFFGGILLAMFLVGAKFADPLPASPADGAVAPARAGSQPAAGVAVLVVLIAVVGGAGPSVLQGQARDNPVLDAGPLPGQLDAYAREDASGDWQPALHGAATTVAARYRRASADRPVDAFLASYRLGSPDGELTDSRNLPFERDQWRRAGGLSVPGYNETVIRPAPRSTLVPGSARVVWSWFVVDGAPTGSRLMAKALELRGLVAGRPVQLWLVALSAPFGEEPGEARRNLGAFAAGFCGGAGVPCPPALVSARE